MSRGVRLGALVALAFGAVALAAGFLVGGGGRALGAVAASWLCCTGLASGAVAVSAAIRLARGRWAGEVLPLAEAGAAFLAPALALLIALLAASRLWMPEGANAGIALAARDVLAGAALLFAARRYLLASRKGGPVARAAVAYLLVYVVTLSLWMVDLVVGLAPWAPSTVLPPFYFMGAFLGGLAWSALLAASRGERIRSDTRYDLGRLLFAFSIFWAYLLWAAYLPTWYGNLPDETGQLLARWHGGWRGPSSFAIVAVFGLPFFFLFPENNKRRPARLAFGAASIIAGLFVTHLLMILPSLAPALDRRTLLAAAAAALVPGVFVLVTVRAAHARLPGDAPV